MTSETPHNPNSSKNVWYDTALSLHVGIAVMGALIFVVAVIQPPGLSPPPAGAIPLFVFTITATAISFILLQRTETLGYATGIVSGGLAVTTVVLVGTGTVGEIPSSTGIQLGPLVYITLGIALVVTSSIAWRKQSTTQTTSRGTPTME